MGPEDDPSTTREGPGRDPGMTRNGACASWGKSAGANGRFAGDELMDVHDSPPFGCLSIVEIIIRYLLGSMQGQFWE
jgi:hypothetical protein